MSINPSLAYAGYLAWLLAGFADFRCHARTDLARTSGLAESALHGIEVVLCAGLLLTWLVFDPSMGVFLLLCLIVFAHAVAGYIDTAVSWRLRAISPAEQHLHSVLDLAPWIGVGTFIYSNASAGWQAGWALPVRAIPLPLWVWALLLVPALVFCGLPLARELLDAIRWRRGANK